MLIIYVCRGCDQSTCGGLLLVFIFISARAHFKTPLRASKPLRWGLFNWKVWCFLCLFFLTVFSVIIMWVLNEFLVGVFCRSSLIAKITLVLDSYRFFGFNSKPSPSLTISRRSSLSHRNQCIDLQSKSMD